MCISFCKEVAWKRLGLRKGRTDGETTALEVFYLSYQCGCGVSHSHSGFFFFFHTGKSVHCLGHYCAVELPVMMEIFNGVGEQVFTGLWSCFIFWNFVI